MRSTAFLGVTPDLNQLVQLGYDYGNDHEKILMRLIPLTAAALLLCLTMPCLASVAPTAAAHKQDSAAAAQYKALKVSKDIKLAAAGTYTLDPHHTSVLAKLDHMGLSGYTLRFDKVDGGFSLDPSTGRVLNLAISIDPSSVDTGDQKFDQQIATKYFETAKYPEMSFTSPVTVVGRHQFSIKGTLNFHGVQKPLVLRVIYRGFTDLDGHPRMGFSGEATFKRSEFGVAQWVPLEADEVRIVIETEFIKK